MRWMTLMGIFILFSGELSREESDKRKREAGCEAYQMKRNFPTGKDGFHQTNWSASKYDF